ncbi:MAG: YkgJ family cysteine cluster protein [Lachnospiraceae bacterium]|jgi:hypothetical protein|nr:YkgJ family cysteine cluster protein [Lachnospiraceae bacterium]
MLREVSADMLTPDNRFGAGDMVKVGCNDCAGCSDCCRDMEATIVLDPYDVYRLTGFLNQSFESLIGNGIELQIVDGLILPLLSMENESGCCRFLNKEGRCSVHPARPGICRMYPLGRIYEGEEFSYFLQKDACPAKNKTKVKIKKWMGEENYAAYEAFVKAWHGLVVKFRKEALAATDVEVVKAIGMKLLQTFYVQGYARNEEIFPQLMERVKQCL